MTSTTRTTSRKSRSTTRSTTTRATTGTTATRAQATTGTRSTTTAGEDARDEYPADDADSEANSGTRDGRRAGQRPRPARTARPHAVLRLPGRGGEPDASRRATAGRWTGSRQRQAAWSARSPSAPCPRCGTRSRPPTGRLTDYVAGDGSPGLIAAVTGAKSWPRARARAGRCSAPAGRASRRRCPASSAAARARAAASRSSSSPTSSSPSTWAFRSGSPTTSGRATSDFPTFTKKIENAQPDERRASKVNWKAQVFWSHREWEATIVDQRPDERIIWQSKGQKGHVDGAVTFHELAPEPDQDRRGPGVPPAGHVRAHRQPLAGPGPARPA